MGTVNGYSRPQTQTGSAAQLRQALGYVPQRPVSAQSPVVYNGVDGTLTPAAGAIDTAEIADGAVTFAKMQSFGAKTVAGRTGPGGGDGELLTLDPNNLNISAGVLTVTSVPKVSFGTGAPGGTPLDGELYFDDTGSPYVGYVGRAGVWQQF